MSGKGRARCRACNWLHLAAVCLNGRCGLFASMGLHEKYGEHQLRNHEVFYGKREQTDAAFCVKQFGWH